LVYICLFFGCEKGGEQNPEGDEFIKLKKYKIEEKVWGQKGQKKGRKTEKDFRETSSYK